MFVGNIFNDAGADTGDIGHSLRFRRAASAYANRTPASTTDRTRWTYSVWVKPSDFGSDNFLFGAAIDANNRCAVLFNSGSLVFFSIMGGTTRFNKISSALFRDPTAFYHIVCVFDSTNATTEDRVKLYVNNTRITSWSTNTFVDLTIHAVNDSTAVHTIGRRPESAANYFDGYMSRIAFVDGQALTPSSFGYLNTEINEWVPKSQSVVKAAVDAGGTNSFMLDFNDATSLTTLGNDFSSKNNDWTLNNFSLTAGTAYDHMLDVPGNSFATLNPLIPSAASLTNGNLTSGTTAVRGTQNALLFDCKWEVTAGGSAVTAGVISATGTLNTTSVTANKTFAFRLTTAGALDYRNVTDAGAWTSVTTGLTGEQYPYGVTQAANWNFGQAPLHASATYQSAAGGYFFDTTAGYKALCQANLPDSGTVVVSGSFTGNASADGPVVWMNGVPDTLTINSNAVTFGTHADKLATGFKLRTSSASYNAAGSNTWTATITSDLKNIFKYNNAQSN